VDVQVWEWAAFVGFILAMLALDLFVFHRDAHEVSLREAATWSVIWMALGLAFGGLIWLWYGGQAAGEYVAGYLIERSLSIDNLFIFVVIFAFFAVPAALQHRVLFLGVVGALVFRAIFIAAGASLLDAFHWMIYVFGAFLVFAAVKMARGRAFKLRPDSNPVLRLIHRAIPSTTEYRGQRFVVREAGKWLATPLLMVLVIVETTDVVFAVDSIPAIFAVTDDTFLVFTSNAFAILGLRALYFLLARMMGRFHYLKYGLAGVLMFVGAKMLVSDLYEIPIWLSLAVIVSAIGAAVVASLAWPPVLNRAAISAPPGGTIPPLEPTPTDVAD
jgi:tellurite resistance protein TerC